MQILTAERRGPTNLLIHIFSYAWVFWFALPYLFLAVVFLVKIDAARAVLYDARFWSAFYISLASAVIVIVLAYIFSIPAAYYLTYHEIRAKDALEALLIDIPQTFPPVAVGVIYLLTLGPGSPINLAFTFLAVVIAKLFVSAPFTLSYTLRKFREIKASKLDLVARSLGADTRQLVFRVLVPMSARDISAGLTMSAARAMGEFGGSLIFAGVIAYKTEVLPTYTNRMVAADPYFALAATTVMTIFAVAAIVTARSIGSKR